MEGNYSLNKFKLLLENLFERKNVLNEHDAEKLIKFLEDRRNSLEKSILDTPGFFDLIFDSLVKISNASISVKAFLIEIITIVLKYELHSGKSNIQSFQALSLKFCIIDILKCVPPLNLHLACIKLASVQLTNSIGLDLIIEHKVWKYILNPNIHHKPKQVTRAAYDFMAKLVWKINEYNSEPVLVEVLGYLVEPILKSEYFNIAVLDAETDAALADKIFTNLSALLAIMNEPVNTKPVKITALLKEYFVLEHRLFKMFNITKNANLLKLLNSCLFRYFLQMHGHLLFSQRADDFCNKITIFHRNYITSAVKKRDAYAIVDFVIQANIHWSRFEKSHSTDLSVPVMFERNGQQIKFSLQILIHILVPVLKYCALDRIRHLRGWKEVIEHFLIKMGKSLTDYIYSSCYSFAKFLDESGSSFKKKLATHTLKELLRLKGHINESQAGPVFQSLYYLLEIFIVSDGAGGLVVSESPIDPGDLRILTHLLDAMTMVLKEHNIPWYENVEIVSIQADLLNLLKQNFLTPKHVVQVLDLLNICIKKFLSPNMSLLVEDKCGPGNTLNEVGEIMKLYSQHEDWEVRDSALNLLNSCTEISFVKYIPLQKVIEENNLIILAAKAALTDDEFYSQCTALKCLAAATKIDSIWQEVLGNYPNIYLQLVYMLRTHGEGMVRRETVYVLTGVYTNQKIAPGFENTLYEVMLSAALDDLHWEVQLAALNFWKCAIHNHLTYRGMLDGNFPPVTFSKEKRKIIILNHAEIQRQLSAIMNHLSRIGCLTVLLECMNEIHSIAVMDQAYCIVKELIELLAKHKFETLLENVDETLESVQIVPTCMEEDNTALDISSKVSEEDRNKVIDSILSANQSELIIDLYDNYSKVESEEMDVDFAYCLEKTYCAARKLVGPDKFIEHFRSDEYHSRIETKKKCCTDNVYTLDGLLDEILEL